MTIHRLDPPIPVSIASPSLPQGIPEQSRKGWAYAWGQPGIDSHRLWVVVMDDSGMVIDVPQPEIRVDPNWSYERRIKQ